MTWKLRRGLRIYFRWARGPRKPAFPHQPPRRRPSPLSSAAHTTPSWSPPAPPWWRSPASQRDSPKASPTLLCGAPSRSQLRPFRNFVTKRDGPRPPPSRDRYADAHQHTAIPGGSFVLVSVTTTRMMRIVAGAGVAVRQRRRQRRRRRRRCWYAWIYRPVGLSGGEEREPFEDGGQGRRRCTTPSLLPRQHMTTMMMMMLTKLMILILMITLMLILMPIMTTLAAATCWQRRHVSDSDFSLYTFLSPSLCLYTGYSFSSFLYHPPPPPPTNSEIKSTRYHLYRCEKLRIALLIALYLRVLLYVIKL